MWIVWQGNNFYLNLFGFLNWGSTDKQDKYQKPACRHIMFTTENLQNRFSKTKSSKKPERGKNFIYRGTRIRITSVFLLETMQARRKGSEIFQVLKNTTSLEFCIQQNYPSNVKEKTFSKKNGGDLSPLDLICKKCLRNSPENNTGQKLRPTFKRRALEKE